MAFAVLFAGFVRSEPAGVRLKPLLGGSLVTELNVAAVEASRCAAAHTDLAPGIPWSPGITTNQMAVGACTGHVALLRWTWCRTRFAHRGRAEQLNNTGSYFSEQKSRAACARKKPARAASHIRALVLSPPHVGIPAPSGVATTMMKTETLSPPIRPLYQATFFFRHHRRPTGKAAVAN